MKLLDRVGRRGPIVMAVSIVVMGLSSQPFFGTDGWAGLGQWVGGIGALAAAWVALNIAGREARHREEADAHQEFVRANFIMSALESNRTVLVRNLGTEPVLSVQVAAYRPSPQLNGLAVSIPLNRPTVDVLMPESLRDVDKNIHLTWDVDPADDSGFTKERLLAEVPGQIEIEFTDLRGNRWARAGNDPVRPAPPSLDAWKAGRKLPKRS